MFLWAVGKYVPMLIGKTWYIPEKVAAEMRNLLSDYNALPAKTFGDIVAFHVVFERIIHPSQDGNGSVGCLILFKECLKHNIVPFIIEDNLKLFYCHSPFLW